MARKKGGRPTSLTPQVQTVITEALEKGLPIRRACELANIDERTYERWKSRGANGEEPFADFCRAVTRARAQCQDNLVAALNIAGIEPNHWKANAWLLERRFPDEWGATINHRVRSEVAKELGDFLAACRDHLTPDVWEQVKGVAERMGERDREGGGDAITSPRH